MLKHLNLKSTKKKQQKDTHTKLNMYGENIIYIFFRISNKQPKLHIYIYIYKQRYTTLHVQDEVTNSTNIIDNNIYKY